jgi:Type II secretion system (T2SS), protein F
MATFIVEVRDSAGRASKERVDATSPEMARSILINRYPSIGRVTKAGFELDFSGFESMMTKVTVKDKAVFSRQFAVMVNAGVAIVRCLGVLGDNCPNPKLKKALLGISTEVQQGNNLSEAMRKYPDSFDKLYVSMVEAGEIGGVLDEVLQRLAKLLEDMAKLQNQIKSAMTYPIAVGILALTVFFAMTIFLIPIFAGIFQDLGVELPALTKFMLWLSSILRSWKVLIPIVTIIVVVTVIKQYYKTPIGRLQIDGLMLKREDPTRKLYPFSLNPAAFRCPPPPNLFATSETSKLFPHLSDLRENVPSLVIQPTKGYPLRALYIFMQISDVNLSSSFVSLTIGIVYSSSLYFSHLLKAFSIASNFGFKSFLPYGTSHPANSSSESISSTLNSAKFGVKCFLRLLRASCMN